jgi:hypothetical protein
LIRPLTLVVALAGFATPAAAAPPETAARRQTRGAHEPVSRPYVRVISETADIYSGAGFSYRVIARVGRDDVLEMVERGKRGGWTRVLLESGISGWVLTEQVVIFSREEEDTEVGPFRRAGRKIRAALLGPPTLLTARAGGTLSAGALGKEGLFLVRPQVFITPNVAVEGYVGPSAGRDVTRAIMGLAGNIYLMPRIPFTFFMSVGSGAVFTRGKVDTVRQSEWSYLLSPGGGALIVFKKGVTLRFDVRNHVLFRAERAQAIQEYSGALAFHF